MSGSEVVVPANKGKAIGGFILGLVFVAYAVYIQGIMGLALLIFFGSGAIHYGLQLLPGARYLRITADGFQVCSRFRQKPLVRWQDTEFFHAVNIGRGSHTIVWKNGAVSGLSDEYTMGPDELAKLLNEWRSRAVVGWASAHPGAIPATEARAG